jgi:hypothetical protein
MTGQPDVARRIDDARASGRKRIFTRLAPTARPGDRVFTEEYGWGTVDTAKVADDLRDSKCTVILDADA